MVWPTRGPLTTYFGEVGPYSPRGHKGIDVAGPMGAPVAAADDGEVVAAGWDNGGYGNRVIVDHGNGMRTLYAHLSQITTLVGQEAQAGQPIGRIGSTGYSTGPHLHFEVSQNGALRDPLAYLP